MNLRKNPPWSGIIKLLLNPNFNPPLLESFQKKISNGSSALFWKDAWVGSGLPLKNRFPRLYGKELNKDILFKNRWAFSNGRWVGCWSLRSGLRGRALDDFRNLETLLINSRFLLSEKDLWFWVPDTKGIFSVRKMYSFFHNNQHSISLQARCKWSAYVPLKVNIFIWRLFLNGLPTKDNLILKGLEVHNPNCVMCNARRHELDHCLFTCPKIDGLWRKIWSWLGMSANRFSLSDDF